jgi:hypothetical protein
MEPLMPTPPTGHWLFAIRTEDRPGAAAAIAVVFSGRGVQIESFVGYGDPRYSAGRTEGVILITFAALRSRMEMVRRLLERLEVVRRVECHDYAEDPGLQKTATLSLSRWDAEVSALLAGFRVAVQADGAGRPTVVLNGRPAEVDRAVAALGERGWLAWGVYALLPPVPAAG